MTRLTPKNYLVLLLLLSGGCQLFGKVAPGSDPIVVNAERAHKTAFETIKLFIDVDSDNRQYMLDNLAEIHAYAEALRAPDETGKSLFQRTSDAAWNAIKTYKQTRTPESGQAMNDAITKISDIASITRAYQIKMPPSPLVTEN